MLPSLQLYNYTNEETDNIKGAVWLTEDKIPQKAVARKALPQHISSLVQALERCPLSGGDAASVDSRGYVSQGLLAAFSRVIHQLLGYTMTSGTLAHPRTESHPTV